jgi:TPR repeat protein
MLNVVLSVMCYLFLGIFVLFTPCPALANMGDIPIGELILQAKNGNAEAQDELGLRYAGGVDVEEDYTEAAKWYRAAAEQGQVKAQNELGGFYEKGIGVPRDLTRAVYWYEKAAAQGYAPAQYNLSLKLSAGEGVKKDEIRSAKWLRKAAEAGWAQAEHNMGVKCLRGSGVKQDLQEAAKWFRRSADHGFPMAMFNLASCYISGEGVKRDVVQAYKWLYLSVGESRRKYLSAKSKTPRKMSHSELTEWLYPLEGDALDRAQKGLELMRQAMTDVQVFSAMQQANDWEPKD